MSMPTLLPQVIGLMHCMYVLCGVRGKTVAPAAGRVRVPQPGTPQAGGTLVPRGQKGAVLLPAASPAGATGDQRRSCWRGRAWVTPTPQHRHTRGFGQAVTVHVRYGRAILHIDVPKSKDWQV